MEAKKGVHSRKSPHHSFLSTGGTSIGEPVCLSLEEEIMQNSTLQYFLRNVVSEFSSENKNCVNKLSQPNHNLNLIQLNCS